MVVSLDRLSAAWLQPVMQELIAIRLDSLSGESLKSSEGITDKFFKQPSNRKLQIEWHVSCLAHAQ